MRELFSKIKTNSLHYKTSNLPTNADDYFCLPALTAGVQNQGLNSYVPSSNATVLKNVISVSANGANTGATFYQSKEFTVLQDAYAIEWIYTKRKLTDKQYLFLVGCISKTIYGNYEWTNKAGWERIKEDEILLPKTEVGEIDFDFMESFVAEIEARRVVEIEACRVAEIEAYLLATELKDYTLTKEEESAIKEYSSLEWKTYNLETLFGKSTRGKRLKGEDRVPGKLPFVTAGEVDEGISAFIGNKVEIFESNTTTIDMFGSAKYRNYRYGADDHVAVVHTELLPMKAAIFVTSAIHKAAHTGEFNYGHNFYAKDADVLNIKLPAKGDEPDYGFMSNYISAIQKLVIRDVVLYADLKIEATKRAIDSIE